MGGQASNPSEARSVSPDDPAAAGGPHRDAEGVWRDLDEPRAEGGPHEDPDEPGQVYDLDEPRADGGPHEDPDEPGQWYDLDEPPGGVELEDPDERRG